MYQPRAYFCNATQRTMCQVICLLYIVTPQHFIQRCLNLRRYSNFCLVFYLLHTSQSKLMIFFIFLGVVHKLRLQEKGGRQSKNVNFFNVKSVNAIQVGGQKSQILVNVVCERSLISFIILQCENNVFDCYFSRSTIIETSTEDKSEIFEDQPLYPICSEASLCLDIGAELPNSNGA